MTDVATSPPVPESSPPAGGSRPSRLLSDSRLARRAQAGDRAAFEAIYQRYHQDLYRFCLAMLGNPADAQDSLQETMVKVLRGLPGETREIHLKPWLYRIARNEAIETIRRRRDSVEIEGEHAVSVSGVSDTAESRDRLRRLIADLEELPERQRAALVMRELGGLGFAEIGEAFQTSPAVARQTIYEARLSLREMEEGREMSCVEVMRELSDGDGRTARRRSVRAHVRGCADCRAFGESIATRHQDFAAIAPLPIALSAGLLHGVLTGQASGAVGTGATAAGAAASATGGAASGGAVGGTGGVAAAGAGKVVAASAIAKAVATVAVVTAVGVSAADRTGLVHIGLPGGAKPAANPSTRGSISPHAKTRAVPTPRQLGTPAAAQSVNPAAAARLAESLERHGPHIRRGSGSRPSGSTEAGRGTQHAHGRGQDASGQMGHRPQGAAAHAGAQEHRAANSGSQAASHRHSRPVRHPHAPPHRSHSHPAPQGAAPTPAAPPSKPSRATPESAPAPTAPVEAETTLPEP